MNMLRLITVCFIVTSELVGGCGRSESSASSSRVHVCVYTALEPEEVGALVPLFEAEHPDIKVDVVRDSTGVITSKLLAESGNPQCDVVWGLAATSLLNADRAGLLEPYSPAGLDQLSPEFRDSRPVPHWEGIDAFMTAFAVNTIECEKAGVPVPAGYGDLISPKYRGTVTMPNPSMSGTGFLTVAGILQTMGEDGGWKYLDQLDRNIAAYTHSGSAPAELAATGEHAIGISFDFRVLKEVRKGAPVRIVFPKEKSGWEMEANALITKPQIKPQAKTFMDWIIGPTAFKYYCKEYGVVANPAYMNTPEGFPARPREQMIRNNFVWAAENRDRILAEWTHRYGAKTGVK